MKTIVCIFRGPSVASAELIAASSNPRIVADFCAALLGDPPQTGDPVLSRVALAKRRALREIRREARGGAVIQLPQPEASR